MTEEERYKDQITKFRLQNPKFDELWKKFYSIETTSPEWFSCYREYQALLHELEGATEAQERQQAEFKILISKLNEQGLKILNEVNANISNIEISKLIAFQDLQSTKDFDDSELEKLEQDIIQRLNQGVDPFTDKIDLSYKPDGDWFRILTGHSRILILSKLGFKKISPYWTTVQKDLTSEQERARWFSHEIKCSRINTWKQSQIISSEIKKGKTVKEISELLGKDEETIRHYKKAKENLDKLDGTVSDTVSKKTSALDFTIGVAGLDDEEVKKLAQEVVDSPKKHFSRSELIERKEKIQEEEMVEDLDHLKGKYWLSEEVKKQKKLGSRNVGTYWVMIKTTGELIFIDRNGKIKTDDEIKKEVKSDE